MQTKAVDDTLKLAAETNKETTRIAAVNTAVEGQMNVALTRQLYEFAQKESEKLMGKKPKLG